MRPIYAAIFAAITLLPGNTPVQCDLHPSLRHHNTTGRDGAGLCVFWSIAHSARYQNDREAFDLAVKMQREDGGGWPEKVDRMMRKYAPGVRYVQHTKGDIEFLRQALRTGRPAAVTYDGRDPHYGPRSVAHMVNLVELTDTHAVILDNNFPDEYVKLSIEDFAARWRAKGGGWAVVLLHAPPAPVPRN